MLPPILRPPASLAGRRGHAARLAAAALAARALATPSRAAGR
jgi:hypothetical protein